MIKILFCFRFFFFLNAHTFMHVTFYFMNDTVHGMLPPMNGGHRCAWDALRDCFSGLPALI